MPPRTKRRAGHPGGRAGQPPLTPADITRAAALKRYREQNELSQAEIGSMLGVSQATVSQYEQAKTRIPDDVFEHLLTEARERMESEVAPTAEEAQLRAAAASMGTPLEGDIPPEVLESLKAMAEAAESGDPEVVEAQLGAVRAKMSEAAAAGLSGDQKAVVGDVRMAYSLLARILGRFDPDLGGLIDKQTGELAVSLVQAAEVSPLLARLVAILRVGPLSNCVIMHVLLVVEYDNIRRARNAERREIAQLEAQRRPQPEPVPLHPTAAEMLDPSLGAFAAA